MEENNYSDEFELFLKESADEFKMVPSRRVWYSLYNNLHPDRRWPSMAVCLLILTAVLYLGIANNNSLSSAARRASTENFTTLLNEKNIDNKITFSVKDYIKSKNQQQQKFSIISTEKQTARLDENTVAYNTPIAASTLNETITSFGENERTLKTQSLSTVSNVKNFNALQENNGQESYVAIDLEANEKINEEKTNDIDVAILPKLITNKITPAENNILKTDLLNIEKSWKEDYAFRNKPAINKFKQNTTISYYITPSLGYRSFSKKSETNLSNAPATSGGSNNDVVRLIDDAAPNFEAGAILQYSISKNLKLKTGLQTNYTNYVSRVTAIGHPSQTSMTLNNNSNHLRSSNYTTKAGEERINKTTMQIALPMGADYKLAGNGNVKWFLGGTIQPTYIVNGSAFVLSTDEKYYISETALLRKLNLNTAVETFISIKTANGVVFNVGPQLRYQLMSTYKKAYNYTEKVYNFGLKIGVTRSL